MLEILGFGQAQRGVDIQFRVIAQLLVGRPDGVLAVDLAPLPDQVIFHHFGFIARLHAHQRGIDVLLNTGDGRGHRAGGHGLADLHIQQLVLVEVVGGLDFVAQLGVDKLRCVRYHLIQIVGHQGIAQGFVELAID